MTSIKTIPADKINLRLILVSGKTKEFLFSPNDSAGDIAQHVFDNWPEDWSAEAVAKADILRLIYQGRFLHSNVTLGALGLVCSKTTVMHLVPRENLPEPNSQGRNVATESGHLMWNDDLSLTQNEIDSFYPTQTPVPDINPDPMSSTQTPAPNMGPDPMGSAQTPVPNIDPDVPTVPVESPSIIQTEVPQVEPLSSNNVNPSGINHTDPPAPSTPGNDFLTYHILSPTSGNDLPISCSHLTPMPSLVNVTSQLCDDFPNDPSDDMSGDIPPTERTDFSEETTSLVVNVTSSVAKLANHPSLGSFEDTHSGDRTPVEPNQDLSDPKHLKSTLPIIGAKEEQITQSFPEQNEYKNSPPDLIETQNDPDLISSPVSEIPHTSSQHLEETKTITRTMSTADAQTPSNDHSSQNTASYTIVDTLPPTSDDNSSISNPEVRSQNTETSSNRQSIGEPSAPDSVK